MNILDQAYISSVFQVDTPYGPMYLTGDIKREEHSWSGKHCTRIKNVINHYSKGTWEKKVSGLLLEESFEVFYDIGAAYGYFSLLCSSKECVEKVIAVEPHPVRFGMLWFTSLDHQKIYPYNCFVSLEEGFSTKSSAILSGMYQNIGKEKLDNFQPTIKRLDDLYIPNKESVVKIDVEGYEKDVLESGPELLSNKNTKIIVEIHKNRVEIQEITDLLNKFGKKVKKELLSSSIVQTLLYG